MKYSVKEVYKNTAVLLIMFLEKRLITENIQKHFMIIDLYFPAKDFIWSLNFIQLDEWISLEEEYKIMNRLLSNSYLEVTPQWKAVSSSCLHF